MAVDKKRLDDYIYYINTLLKQEDFYDTYMDGIKKGQNKYTISQRFQKKKFDLDWVEAIEDCVISLDTIVRNPRKFIVIEEDIVDVSLARNITTESVKHLATHTNLIASVNKDGMVIPSKILNTSKEESFEVYENRFIYTLLLKLHQFITSRFDVIRRAAITSDNFVVNVESKYNVGKSVIEYKMETILNMPLDEVLKADPTELTDVERIARLQNVVNGFMGSPFAKTMVSCALVRPPIIRTNVILKNPDFKKALVLWQFIDSYQQTGYEIKSINETAELPAGNQDKYNNLIYLNNILAESIVRTRTTELDVVGEEEEKKKDKVQANEYITKNIDDFVPDDFPELKLSLFETKRVFTKLPEVAEVSREEERKINRAIERCLLQYKINKAKEDSEQQARYMRKLMEEETKAKVEALKAHKEAEKRAEREKKLAEKQFAREEKERKRLEKERAMREEAERVERIRLEEEQALKERLEKEQAEAERRILEENERLSAMLESEKARIQMEKDNLREQLEREKRLQFLEPVEADAMLKLRKKEQLRIKQMRSAQEMALRELITAHYQDMERQQQQAILDMEQIADMCDFDIFDEHVDVSPTERAEDIVIGDTPSAEDFTKVDLAMQEIPEMDTSLTTRDRDGNLQYENQLRKEDEQDEVDPTAARSEMTMTSYKPSGEKKADDDWDEDITFTGFDAPIDATAKYQPNYKAAAENAESGKIARPSAMMGAKPKLAQLDDDWDFEGLDQLAKKEEERKKEDGERKPLNIRGGTVDQSKGKKGGDQPQFNVYVPKPRNTVSVTQDTLDEILGNHDLVGNREEPDEGKKKKRFGRK